MAAFVLRVFGFFCRSFRLFGCAAKFDFDIGLFAAAPNAQSHFFARHHRADHDRQVAGGTDFFSVYAADNIADLQPGLLRCAVRHDFGNQRAACFVQTERFGQIVRNFLDNHA